MRLVIQRVTCAELWADGVYRGEIRCGLVAFIGIAQFDKSSDADFLAEKLLNLRLFPDKAGKMNHNVREAAGGLMIVPNFTLYGDTSKGRRPSFDQAAKPVDALPLYTYFLDKLLASGIVAVTGVFQAHMRVLVENDGPVTLICNSPPERGNFQGRAL